MERDLTLCLFLLLSVPPLGRFTLSFFLSCLPQSPRVKHKIKSQWSPEQEVRGNLPMGTVVLVTTRDFLSLPVSALRQEVKGKSPQWEEDGKKKTDGVFFPSKMEKKCFAFCYTLKKMKIYFIGLGYRQGHC